MGVRIELDPPTPIPAGLSYDEKHRWLAAEARQIHVRLADRGLYTTTVPRGVFNPCDGVAAHALIDCILEGSLDVTERSVVDLGCGSGVVGLACILMDAACVLFTDVNPAVAALRNHPLLRPDDEVAVQDLLHDVPDASRDVVVMSTPTAELLDDGETDPARTNFGADRGLLVRLAHEAARVLRPGGELCVWVSTILPPDWMEPFVGALHERFDPATLRVLRPPPERSGSTRWMVMAIRT